MPEENKTSESRVRMNISQNAKGVVQFDITAEYPNCEMAAVELGKAIDLVKATCEAKGLKLADSAA